MTGQGLDQVPFPAHVELLRWFVGHREAIVARIEGLLNAQRKPAQYLQDRPLLSRQFGDCFFTLPGITHEQTRLRGQLEEAHWASGFRPRKNTGLHNDLVDPAEMMVRAFHLWLHTRWPGRNGRVHYAQTLFNVFLLRLLTLLSMRLWDAGASSAGERLAQVQDVLDGLWSSAPANQPALVRDARWLIPMAQSPTTDELAAYFDVAERVAESLSEEDRLEIHKAGVETGGGHLRSQLRHYCMTEGVSLDDHGLILKSRKSNALDFALLVQGLVPLLEAYERARDSGNAQKRLQLADAICQGISPDPELFLNRVDLLGPYSMIEHLFVTTDDEGNAAYTPMGQRHMRLFREFEARIGRCAKSLHEDCPTFEPIEGAYSPYGLIYGFSSNLIEHMALKTLQPEGATEFSLKDAFLAGKADKLDWVSGWRKLPHIDREVEKLFDYPRQFAESIHARIEHELRKRVSQGSADAALRTGRLFVLRDTDSSAPEAAAVPDLSVRYIGSSDPKIVAAHAADSYDAAQLVHDRQEGYFVLSYETAGGWVAITKDILSEVLGAGKDVKLVGLSPMPAGVLRLMCPTLVVFPEDIAEEAPRE